MTAKPGLVPPGPDGEAAPKLLCTDRRHVLCPCTDAVPSLRECHLPSQSTALLPAAQPCPAASAWAPGSPPGASPRSQHGWAPLTGCVALL